MDSDSDRADPPAVDLRSLVAHAHHFAHTATVDEVLTAFGRLDVDFVGVLDGANLLGVCSRRELAQSLGSRFGFALNAHRPIHEHLMANSLRVVHPSAITEVFKSASSRGSRDFYDDLVLIDEAGRYLGMIPMHALVRLQTEFLLGTIKRVEASRVEIAEKNLRMEKDLRMAGEVQNAMLPRAFDALLCPEGVLEFAHRYVPTDALSGDFFDILRISDGVAGILICDVMGHGVRSALVTAMVRTLVEQLLPSAADPGEFLTRLNRGLRDILRGSDELIFVTAAYLVIDVAARTLRYAQAGHPTPLVWKADEDLLRPVRCGDDQAGPALGLTDDFTFSASEEIFQQGDRIILYTDGVYEAASGQGEEFGPLRMAGALSRRIGEPIGGWLDGLLSEVLRFSDERLADDVCVVAASLSRIPAA